VYDFTERTTGQRAKPVDRPTDRHHCEAVNIVRQAQHRAHFVFAAM
jgi:hypothetical protein